MSNVAENILYTLFHLMLETILPPIISSIFTNAKLHLVNCGAVKTKAVDNKALACSHYLGPPPGNMETLCKVTKLFHFVWQYLVQKFYF